jgi:hypothetical protein
MPAAFYGWKRWVAVGIRGNGVVEDEVGGGEQR